MVLFAATNTGFLKPAMFNAGTAIAIGIFGLFCWLTGGIVLLSITCVVGFITLLGLTVRILGGYINMRIEDCTEWDDD